MLLWTAFAVMTAFVLWALVRPLVRSPDGDPAADHRASALAVYRDQLAEIETERARGVLEGAEAEAARVEVARRLLTLAEDARPAPPVKADAALARPNDKSAYALLSIPVLAAGLYLALGSPGLPGRPYWQERHVLEQAGIEHLVAQVEARLRTDPTDGRGWDVVAPVYLRLGRHEEAREAFAHASRLLGRTPRRLLGEAEAILLSRDGVVTEPTRALWLEVLTIEPDRVEPRFWLALAKEQEGKTAEAVADYRALLARPGEDQPWRGPVRQRLAALVRGETAVETVPPRPSGPPLGASASAPGGPSQGDLEAAARMTPEDRQRMIEGMVEGLAQRLAANGADAAGWQRLVQSQMVLGRRDDARGSLMKAREALVDDRSALMELEELAQRLGLGLDRVPAAPTPTPAEPAEGGVQR